MYSHSVIKLKPKSDYYISAFRLFLCTILFDAYFPIYLADRTRRHNLWLLDTNYNRSLIEYLEKESYITSFYYENKIIQEPVTFIKHVEKNIVCIIKLKK